MYCDRCGNRVEATARFCDRCGNQFAPGNTSTPKIEVRLPSLSRLRAARPRMAGAESGSPSWKTLVQASAVAILIGFFLPWASVACNPRALGLAPGSPQPIPAVAASGFDLATGQLAGQKTQGAPGLWLLPIAGVVGLGVTFLAGAARPSAVAIVVAALLAGYQAFAAWQAFEVLRAPNPMFGNQVLFEVSIQLGLPVSVLGLLGLLVAGGLGLAESVTAYRAPPERGPNAAPY